MSKISHCCILFIALKLAGCGNIFEPGHRLTDDYLIIDTGTIIKPLLRELEEGRNTTLIDYVTAYGITEERIYIINFPRLDEHKGKGPLSQSVKDSLVCEYFIINHIDHSVKEYTVSEWIDLYREDIFKIKKPLRNLHFLPNRKYCYDRTISHKKTNDQ